MSIFKRPRKAPAQDPTSIGNLLVSKGVISQDQLKNLLDLQKEQKDLFGELCVARGYCTREQIELIYVRQRELRKERVDYHMESTKLIDSLSRRVRSIGNAFDDVRETAAKAAAEEAKVATGGLKR